MYLLPVLQQNITGSGRSKQPIKAGYNSLFRLVRPIMMCFCLLHGWIFLQEDFARQQKSMKDARSQYEAGVSDKIDYQRASISLNNIKAEIYGTREEIKAKYAYLKEVMGYPADQPLKVSYDSIRMMKDAWIDTLRGVNYHNRIEYQLLLTGLKIAKVECKLLQAGFFT